MGEITSLLQDWTAGKAGAREALFERVYPDLKRISARRLSEVPARPLEVTELAHETFLRLVRQQSVEWESRGQFFAISARLVRRVLVDEGRHRLRSKRGAGAVHLSLESISAPGADGLVDVLALDEALTQLASIQALAAEVVELRFFAGLSIEETAIATGMGRATVVRSWRFARAWLARRMAPAA